MPLIKTLVAANKSEKEKLRIPRSVQQSVPIRCIYSDGMWHCGTKHSRTWRFSDINYIAASEDDRRNIFASYSAVLNSLPTDALTKITIVNHRLNPAEFEKRILLKERGDGLDHYREEANEILLERATASNNLVQEKYITLSIPARKPDASRAYFRRVEANLVKSFAKLGSNVQHLGNAERLRIFHDFFRPGEEQFFDFDRKFMLRRGMDIKDIICPDGISFKNNYFEIGDRFGRVLFLRDYAAYIRDEMISNISDFARDLVLSIDILPVPTDEAIKEVQSQMLGIETDITRWQQRQNARNNFTAVCSCEFCFSLFVPFNLRFCNCSITAKVVLLIIVT